MQEQKEKKAPEITETKTPEEAPKQGLSHWLEQHSRLWLGVTLGAVFVALAATVAVGILLVRWPESAETTVTVYETVYVPMEVTRPTLPPPEANPLKPEDFVVENGFLTCTARPSMLGIDVSTFQKSVDWEQVKAAGVEFVILRAGHRGTDVGGIYEDELVRQHYAGAHDAGLKVGFYFFSQAITPEEAVKEAEFVLDLVWDWQVDMPIVFDWEPMGENARTEGLSPRKLTDCAKAFCDRIIQAGLEPMIYFNAKQSRQDMYLSELTDYKFWLAMYSHHMTYEYRVDMWQYTQSGRVPGIEGDVDINLYFPES